MSNIYQIKTKSPEETRSFASKLVTYLKSPSVITVEGDLGAGKTVFAQGIAEGLDIKTLTTLILATPKTDIEQAVGRILREKHEQPLVIDIVDNHEVFKKQWDKRKAYYLKNNYKKR